MGSALVLVYSWRVVEFTSFSHVSHMFSCGIGRWIVPPELSDVDPGILAQHPWLLWGIPISIVLTFVAGQSKKVREILGPIGRWLDEREEKRIARRRRQLIAQGELDDARLADAEQEIKYLKSQREKDRAERAAADRRHSDEIAELRLTIEQLRSELKAANAQITDMLSRRLGSDAPGA